MSSAGERFETGLWASRWMVLVGVVSCAVLALTAFVLGVLDTLQVVASTIAYAIPSLAERMHPVERTEVVTLTAKAVDTFLIGAILYVVALGLYELFIRRIGGADSLDGAPQVLRVRTLDDLKARIARLVLLVLVVEFFGLTLKLPVTSWSDILALGLGIFLISVALYVSERGH